METLLQVWAVVLEHGAEWLPAITALIAGANGITMLTPTQTDNKVLNIVLKVLNWASLNILKNKNADAA